MGSPPSITGHSGIVDIFLIRNAKTDTLNIYDSFYISLPVEGKLISCSVRQKGTSSPSGQGGTRRVVPTNLKSTLSIEGKSRSQALDLHLTTPLMFRATPPVWIP